MPIFWPILFINNCNKNKNKKKKKTIFACCFRASRPTNTGSNQTYLFQHYEILNWLEKLFKISERTWPPTWISSWPNESKTQWSLKLTVLLNELEISENWIEFKICKISRYTRLKIFLFDFQLIDIVWISGCQHISFGIEIRIVFSYKVNPAVVVKKSGNAFACRCRYMIEAWTCRWIGKSLGLFRLCDATSQFVLHGIHWIVIFLRLWWSQLPLSDIVLSIKNKNKIKSHARDLTKNKHQHTLLIKYVLNVM